MAGAPETKAWEFADASVDLLLVDDCDSAPTARAELKAWTPKLAPGALVLFHGLALERTPPLRQAWDEAVSGHASLEFSEGIGLGLALWQAKPETSGELLDALFSNDARATISALASSDRPASRSRSARRRRGEKTRGATICARSGSTPSWPIVGKRRRSWISRHATWRRRLSKSRNGRMRWQKGRAPLPNSAGTG